MYVQCDPSSLEDEPGSSLPTQPVRKQARIRVVRMYDGMDIVADLINSTSAIISFAWVGQCAISGRGRCLMVQDITQTLGRQSHRFRSTLMW